MGELHSITGLFYETVPGMLPWGGHFIRGIGGIGNAIEGMLADAYGMSRITGTMDDQVLEFRKEYETYGFMYTFRPENGIWLGEYQSTIAQKNGRAVCKTHLCIKDIEFKEFDMTTPERRFESIITSLIESGQLVEVKS